MSETLGHRRADVEAAGTVDYNAIEPGDYWRPNGRPDGEWWFKDPAGRVGRITTPPWTITEHDDGTLTVSPSIFDSPDGWHGFLVAGVWRSV